VAVEDAPYAIRMELIEAWKSATISGARLQLHIDILCYAEPSSIGEKKIAQARHTQGGE
jgi:hypothetical protein